MNSENCVICGEALSSAPKVTVTRGMKTLYECSSLRNDGFFVDKSTKSVELHIHCRNSYTKHPDRIVTASSKFDFKTTCLFCDIICFRDEVLCDKENADVLMVT